MRGLFPVHPLGLLGAGLHRHRPLRGLLPSVLPLGDWAVPGDTAGVGGRSQPGLLASRGWGRGAVQRPPQGDPQYCQPPVSPT